MTQNTVNHPEYFVEFMLMISTIRNESTQVWNLYNLAPIWVNDAMAILKDQITSILKDQISSQKQLWKLQNDYYSVNPTGKSSIYYALLSNQNGFNSSNIENSIMLKNSGKDKQENQVWA